MYGFILRIKIAFFVGFILAAISNGIYESMSGQRLALFSLTALLLLSFWIMMVWLLLNKIRQKWRAFVHKSTVQTASQPVKKDSFNLLDQD